jgi:enoyl-[acyl-carrier protein] reductase I
MTSVGPNWEPNTATAVGKGATVQQFVASAGGKKLEIEIAPWGEGRLKVDGREIARIDEAKDTRRVFRDLKQIAQRYLQGEKIELERKASAPTLPRVKAKLLDGKRGLIVGIANENSIAWGCAKAFRAFGAELAVTYLNDKAKKCVEPLAQTIEARMLLPLDVNAEGQMEAVFQRITKE